MRVTRRAALLVLISLVAWSAPRGVAFAQGAVAKSSGAKGNVAKSKGAPGVPALVILVRHAEKATVGGNDPDLSEAGQVRATALATALSDAHVTAVITSTYKRTSETAEPYASAHGITVEKVALEGGTPAHVAAVAAAVRKHSGEVVLVVGHNNTIPAIIAALGGPKLPDICDASYATLFMLHPAKSGTSANVVRAKYGAADPEGSESCTTPMR